MVLYQDKVIELKDELQEATKQINMMASEYNTMKESLSQHDGLIDSLNSENARLRALLEEYHADKKVWEDQTNKFKDEVNIFNASDLKLPFYKYVFSFQLENRIESLTKTLKEREELIEDLQSTSSKKLQDSLLEAAKVEEDDPESVALLSEALKEREKRIEELKEKLMQASRYVEMNNMPPLKPPDAFIKSLQGPLNEH